MANKSSFKFDARPVERAFKKLGVDLAAIVLPSAMFDAGNALLKDAIYFTPQAPKKFGKLRGSARTQGEGDLDKPTNTKRKAMRSGEELSILAGFNIVYAARQHEWPEGKVIHWTTDKGATSPGRKYLESKMGMFRSKYTEIIGMKFKEYLESPKNWMQGGR